MKSFFKNNWLLCLIGLAVIVVISRETVEWLRTPETIIERKPVAEDYWVAPSLFLDNQLEGAEREQVIYGEELIMNTSRYFGPNGTVSKTTNGMNCQNCHLDGGKKEWGNNYGAVYSTYPKFRDRSGAIETIPKRVNDCFERSLNGTAIDTNGKEMKAIVAYMKWLGQDIKRNEKPRGSGITELAYLDRPASSANGKALYEGKCQTCHGLNGEGLANAGGTGFVYPPLWGKSSYNNGAGLYRLSRFAGFIKDNMPFDQASHKIPYLTDEEAWDIAAYVNSQSRPVKDISRDWPDISKKPVDHPFGPYEDGFSEHQHKYGPFQPIIDSRKKQKEKKMQVESTLSKNDLVRQTTRD